MKVVYGGRELRDSEESLSSIGVKDNMQVRIEFGEGVLGGM